MASGSRLDHAANTCKLQLAWFVLGSLGDRVTVMTGEKVFGLYNTEKGVSVEPPHSWDGFISRAKEGACAESWCKLHGRAVFQGICVLQACRAIGHKRTARVVDTCAAACSEHLRLDIKDAIHGCGRVLGLGWVVEYWRTKEVGAVGLLQLLGRYDSARHA